MVTCPACRQPWMGEKTGGSKKRKAGEGGAGAGAGAGSEDGYANLGIGRIDSTTMYSYTMHCIHTLYTHIFYTMHCTHTLYTHTLTMHCTHTLYTHILYTMHCTHTLYTHTPYAMHHTPRSTTGSGCRS
jgi:hypothetical protein